MPKILIVDSDHISRNLTKDILEESKFEVTGASSGNDCLDLLKKGKPDLILMDYNLTGENGIETVKKIRNDANLKNLKIIFLTVRRFSDIEVDNINSLGVLEYIPKPFDAVELVKKVNLHLGIV